MKFILSSLALFALLFTVPTAQAQYTRGGWDYVGGTSTGLNAGTNNVAYAATNSYTGYVIDAEHSEHVSLFISFKCLATNDLGMKFVLLGSVDGSNYSTVEQHRITVTANGTNTVSMATNLTVGALRYLKLSSIENINTASAMTNVMVIRGLKR